MGELSEYWKDVSPILKEQNQKNREENFNSRLEYAKKQFEQNDIPYKLCNESIGHFNLYFDNKVVMSFWSWTGKIKGEENRRGIKACIKLYNKNYKRKDNKINIMEAKSKIYIVYNSELKTIIGRYEKDNQEVICKLDSILANEITMDFTYKPKWYLKEANAENAIQKFSDGLDMSNFKIIQLEFEDKPTTDIVRNAIKAYFEL